MGPTPTPHPDTSAVFTSPLSVAILAQAAGSTGSTGHFGFKLSVPLGSAQRAQRTRANGEEESAEEKEKTSESKL